MDKKRYRAPFLTRMLPYLVCIIVFGLVLSLVVSGLSDASETADAEGIRIAKESIRKAVINCYATEGNYPPDYEYLTQHYGISVDERKYIIHYEIFASNIMPDITITTMEGQVM